jgi:hypothetical protein
LKVPVFYFLAFSALPEIEASLLTGAQNQFTQEIKKPEI